MEVAARQSLWKTSNLIPYPQVEWLEGNGSTKWMSTGLTVGDDHKAYQIEIQFCFTSQPSQDTWVFGGWNSVPSTTLYLVGYYSGIRCGAGPDNSSYWANIAFDTNWHIAQLKNDGAYWDGIYYKPTALTSISPLADVPLFKSTHVNGSTIPRRIKYCKIWTLDDKLIRHYVPVVVNNVGCMYDVMNKTLTYSAGSEAFGAGPIVVEGLAFYQRSCDSWKEAA